MLPALWEAVCPNAETRVFEEAADRLRAEAMRRVETLGTLDAPLFASLGESQAYHVRAALALYHYVNPKLSILTSAID